MSDLHKPFIISVEGIIGAGKSTFIEKTLVPLLEEKGYKVSVVMEPVGKWGDILSRFYQDPKRWSYHFQTKAYLDRVSACIDCWERGGNKSDIIITDRSVISDTFFMDLLHESGDVDGLEYRHYLEWWAMWSKILPFRTNLFIYLDTPIKKAMEQLRKRNRDGESGVSEEYQLKLQEKHNLYFKTDKVSLNGSDRQVPVYKIFGNEISDISVKIIENCIQG